MDIGITLLFSVTEDNNLLGVLKSYVIECKDKYSVIDKAFKKAEDQINLNYPNYKFLGIEDVFSVSGKVGQIELMGRSTLFDIGSLTKAKELVGNEKDLDVSNESNYYCGSLVYFYEGGIKGEKGYAFTILATVKGESKEIAFKNLKDIATNSKTIDKIAQNSVESIVVNKIIFVGIEDIEAITEDVENGGSFQVLFNDEFNTEIDLLSMLPSKEELDEIINDVFIVPKHKAESI